MTLFVCCRLFLCTWEFLILYKFAARYVFSPQCICLPSQFSVCERTTTFSLPNIASWCMDVLGKGLFAYWSISSSGLVLQHECSLKNMHLFSLRLQWIIFSSSHNGKMGCAKQHVPGIKERCFSRTENVLKNASSCWQGSGLYIMNWGFSFHGSLQSTVLTSTSSEDVQRL